MKTFIKTSQGELPLQLSRDGEKFELQLADRKLTGEVLLWDPPRFQISVGGQSSHGIFFRGNGYVDVHLPEGTFRLRYPGKRGRTEAQVPAGGLTAPMPAKIVKILVKEGDSVERSDSLMILEAMKMEHKILSPQKGTVRKIFFREGARVSQDEELIELK